MNLIMLSDTSCNYANLLRNLLKKENIPFRCTKGQWLLSDDAKVDSIIFKRINQNRPADFYKYKEEDIFLCFVGHSGNREEFEKFEQSLTKKRKFIYVETFSEILTYISEEVKPYYRLRNQDMVCVKYSKYKPEYYSETLAEEYENELNRISEKLDSLELEKLSLNNQKKRIEELLHKAQ